MWTFLFCSKGCAHDKILFDTSLSETLDSFYINSNRLEKPYKVLEIDGWLKAKSLTISLGWPNNNSVTSNEQGTAASRTAGIICTWKDGGGWGGVFIGLFPCSVYFHAEILSFQNAEKNGFVVWLVSLDLQWPLCIIAWANEVMLHMF